MSDEDSVERYIAQFVSAWDDCVLGLYLIEHNLKDHAGAETLFLDTNQSYDD